MVTDTSLAPKGPVAEVFYEELRSKATPAGPAGEVVTSVRSKYDEAERAVEVTSKAFGSETFTLNKYDGARLVSQESTSSNNKNAGFASWNYWIYDASGKLTEFRRGGGDEIQNHIVNLKRDTQGRLVSFEYRQGAKDALFNRMEYRYSSNGKTIDSTSFDAAGNVGSSTTAVLDDRGHVASVVIRNRDAKTKALATFVRVAFRYDASGRLTEQVTDTTAAISNEQDLPPGKVSITYDDSKRTKTTAYSGKEGSLSSTITSNSSGETIGIVVRTGSSSVDVRLECAYDKYENWTTCQQVAKQGETRESDITVVNKMWRRTITYR